MEDEVDLQWLPRWDWTAINTASAAKSPKITVHRTPMGRAVS